jgi:putative oxidoreductase
MVDFALLIIRATFGTLLAGHGAQKLFGWFGGPGPEGTRGIMGSMGLQPAETWATLAGTSEFGGGVLTALGLLNPLGEMGIMGSMAMATAKVHWGKPIWVTSGGAELPVTNMAIATALTLAGPGKYSLDNALGTRLPRWIAIPGLAAVAAGIYMGLQSSYNAQQSQVRESGAQPQAGGGAAPAV